MIVIDAFLEVLGVAVVVILGLNLVGMALYTSYLIGIGAVNLFRYFLKKPTYEIEDYVGV